MLENRYYIINPTGITMTEIEKIILSKSGWDNFDNFGLMVFEVKTSKGKEMAHVMSQFNNDEILIRYAIPNIKGKKISVSFNRTTQQLNANKTDKEIFDKSDISDFLMMVDTMIKKSKGMYVAPTKVMNQKTEIV